MENKNSDKSDKKKKKKTRKDSKRRRRITKAKIVNDLAGVRAHQLLQTFQSSEIPGTDKSKGIKTTEEKATKRRASGPPANKTSLRKHCDDITDSGTRSTRNIVDSTSLAQQKEDEQIESMRLEAALEAMRLLKKAQKEFTWDIVTPPKKEVKMREIKQKKIAPMSKEKALKILGLYQEEVAKNQKKVTDFTEDEILGAFTEESQKLGKVFYIEFRLLPFFQLEEVSHQIFRTVMRLIKFF